MPFINSKVSVEITKQQQEQLKKQLGEAISAIRGKSESWLMLNFEDNQRMYFRGSNSEPVAFIDVKIYGRAGADEYNRLAARITEIFGKILNISADHVYVAYQETEYWGYNSRNF